MIKIIAKENIRIDNQVSMKREDLNHPTISGNKLRKLKYNLIAARDLNLNTLLTFGGAFSNHILAVAAAGHSYGFKTIGVIRGEELENRTLHNPTLEQAKSMGMCLKFISRADYRQKNGEKFIAKLKQEFGDFYLIPEGGTNKLAVKGCEEILDENDESFDYICCSVGTGGTISGIINSSFESQTIVGFSALKGDFLNEEISTFATRNNWTLVSDYHFGGYAKVNEALIGFINQFKLKYGVPLDPIYTGKMMFGIYDLMAKGYFKKNAKILAIHTGGLQGVEGMNIKLKEQQLPLIV